MRKLLSAVLAGLMLTGAVLPACADETAPGLILAESSHLLLDRENGYVDMIDGTITVGELKANFTGDVDVADKSDDKAVATDDTVTAGEDSLKALIYGDVNRDGKIAIPDVTEILKHIAKWDPDINVDAADVDGNDKINVNDVTKMLKKIAKWDDISLGNVRLVFENTKITAENESADLDLYFESPLTKFSRSNTENTGKNSYKIKLARNETESCQFYIAADKSMQGLTVELAPFEHEYGEGTLDAEMFIYYYYHFPVHTNLLEESGDTVIEEDEFVEPLLPLADSFEVTEGKSQGFAINVTAGKDAPAGMYKAQLSIKNADGNVIKCANVYTYVWDFTLPDTPYSKSSFGMSGYSIYANLGMPAGDDHKTHAEHYDFLLDHNISAYQLPYDILDERADAYMNDPRVTSFEICGENLRYPDEDNADTVLARWEKVQSNPEWAEKGHFYYVDEPYGASGASLVKGQHEYLTELLKTDDFDVILPFFNSDVDSGQYIDMIAAIEPYVDIFVPRSDGFHANLAGVPYGRSPWTSRGIVNKLGENLPRIKALGEDPEHELWWYVCVDPGYPYPNLFTWEQGNMNRVLWWQQFIFDTEGFLYWATQYEWDKLYGSKYNSGNPDTGDGLLMYLGEKYGRTGPVASYRLIQIRDGFDDFDYLKMAEELVGREEVMKIVNRLTTDVLKVNEDPDVMIECRDEIAEIILANQK